MGPQKVPIVMFINHHCHILHVTDNDADHRLFGELVDKNPALVLDHATSAIEALNKLNSAGQKERPNFVWIDWVLSGAMSGEELLAALKSDHVFKSIPVLVFANALAPGDIKKIYGLGASCVVMRKLALDEFAHTVDLIYRFWGSIATLPYCDPAKPAIAR